MTPRIFKTEAGLAAFLRSRPGSDLHVTVAHDDGCTPTRCSCRPWYRVSELTADAVLEGERNQRAWLAECAARLN